MTHVAGCLWRYHNALASQTRQHPVWVHVPRCLPVCAETVTQKHKTRYLKCHTKATENALCISLRRVECYYPDGMTHVPIIASYTWRPTSQGRSLLPAAYSLQTCCCTGVISLAFFSKLINLVPSFSFALPLHLKCIVLQDRITDARIIKHSVSMWLLVLVPCTY